MSLIAVTLEPTVQTLMRISWLRLEFILTLNDAILCGKQRYRSHSRTVPAFSDRNFLGEAS
jgi:hypothetical protein